MTARACRTSRQARASTRTPSMPWTRTIPAPVVLELLQPPLVGAVAHGGFRARRGEAGAQACQPDLARPHASRGRLGRGPRMRLLRHRGRGGPPLPRPCRAAGSGPLRRRVHDRCRHAGTHAEPCRTAPCCTSAGRASGKRFTRASGRPPRTLGDILTADAPKETTVRIPRNTPPVVMVARPFATPPGAAAASRRERTDAGN